MSPGERLLSLAARLPGALLPFAAALGLALASTWAALGAAAAALFGYWAAQRLAPWILARVQQRHMLLCTAVSFVVLSVLLIVAVEQNALGTAVLLSGAAGLTAPIERAITPHRRLDRTAIGAGFLLALVCGLLSAWTVPLVAGAFIAATAVPMLLMSRAQPPKNSSTASL